MTSTSNRFFEDIRSSVDRRLGEYLAAKREQARGLAGPGEELVGEIAALTLRGGKRLRPLLLSAAFSAVAPERSWSATVDAGAAIELLQSYLLIHDDWMDGDEERRGGPSVHAALTRRHGQPHLGASLGILAGDFANACALELLAQAPFPDGRWRDGLLTFVQMSQEVILGQELDLLGDDDVLRTHQLKTGSYTVRGPVRLGAVLANATVGQLQALEAFAAPLGVAFQVADDLLGTFGDVAALGRKPGGDLRAGKRTAVLVQAQKLMDEMARARVAAVFGNAKATDEELSLAVEALAACGVREALERQHQALIDASLAALSATPLPTGGPELLIAACERLGARLART